MSGEPKVRITVEQGPRYLLIEGELWLLRELLTSLRLKGAATGEVADQLNTNGEQDTQSQAKGGLH